MESFSKKLPLPTFVTGEFSMFVSGRVASPFFFLLNAPLFPTLRRFDLTGRSHHGSKGTSWANLGGFVGQAGSSSTWGWKLHP